jgi:hypothetical protein
MNTEDVASPSDNYREAVGDVEMFEGGEEIISATE